jgi:hypothetical protein
LAAVLALLWDVTAAFALTLFAAVLAQIFPGLATPVWSLSSPSSFLGV